MGSIDEIFPVIPQIRSYSKNTLVADIQAAVTIAFVLIPQAIAFSSLAGVTPMRALVSAVYPVLFYAIFGASRHLSVGPEALSSVLVGFAAIKEFKAFGGDLNDLAVLLGFLTGAMAIGLSFLHAGFIDSLLSGYMLCGFVTGVATLIIVEQIPAMCGVAHLDHVEKGTSTFQTLMQVMEKIEEGNYHAGTMVLGFSCLGVLIGFKFFKKFYAGHHDHRQWIKKIPDILVIVMISVILSYYLDFAKLGIATLGVFDNTLPLPKIPSFTFAQINRLTPDILVITLVGFIESQTVTRTFGLKNGYYPSGDRELFALGSCNLLGSVFGSYVTFGSLPRSRILATSGGKSTLAGPLAALLVFVLATNVGSMLKLLPKATLGAVVMNAGINLIEYHEIFFLFKVKSIMEIIMLLLTFGITLFISIDFGILLCIALSVLFTLRKTTSVKVALLGRITYAVSHSEDSKILQTKQKFVDVQDYPDAELLPGFLCLALKTSLEFYNASRLRRRIEMLLQVGVETMSKENSESASERTLSELMNHGSKQDRLFVHSIHSDLAPRNIIIDFNQCDEIDISAAHVLLKIIHSLKKQNCIVKFTGLRPLLKTLLDRSGVSVALGQDNYHESVKDAVDASKSVSVV